MRTRAVVAHAHHLVQHSRHERKCRKADYGVDDVKQRPRPENLGEDIGVEQSDDAPVRAPITTISSITGANLLMTSISDLAFCADGVCTEFVRISTN